MDESHDLSGQEEPQNFVESGEMEKILNPWFAVIFSFIVPGWGQWYCGRTWDGIKFWGSMLLLLFISMALEFFLFRFSSLDVVFLIQKISLVIALGIWIYGIYHAYQTVEKINRREVEYTGKSHLFWLPAIAAILIVVYIVFIFIALAAFTAADVVTNGSVTAGYDAQAGNISATVQQPDSNHIIVTINGGWRKLDEIRELWVTVTDDNGQIQRKILALDYSKVTPGEQLTFIGNYSGSNYVYSNVVFNDFNQTELLNTYV
jgi:hypothetical protein